MLKTCKQVSVRPAFLLSIANVPGKLFHWANFRECYSSTPATPATQALKTHLTLEGGESGEVHINSGRD